jgi:hypothetical protein
LLVLNNLKWEAIVGFVHVDGIVNQYCVCFLFIIESTLAWVILRVFKFISDVPVCRSTNNLAALTKNRWYGVKTHTYIYTLITGPVKQKISNTYNSIFILLKCINMCYWFFWNIMHFADFCRKCAVRLISTKINLNSLFSEFMLG